MLNVFVVAGALFLIGTVAAYAWLTRTEKPITPAATLPEQKTAESNDASKQQVLESGDAAEQDAPAMEDTHSKA